MPLLALARLLDYYYTLTDELSGKKNPLFLRIIIIEELIPQKQLKSFSVIHQ